MRPRDGEEWDTCTRSSLQIDTEVSLELLGDTLTQEEEA